MSDENKIIIPLVVVNLFLAGLICFLFRLLSIKLPEIFVAIPYQPANISINASADLGVIKPFWLGFAQGGEEMGGMLGGTVTKMKNLRPSYIRIDHIFDDDYYGVVSGSSGNLQFNWGKLDREVDAITAMGAKPFLSLSYMPSVMAGSKIDAPGNWQDWQRLVQATVEHYSGRGAKNLSGVYYEVWNEPDIPSFGAWQRSGGKNYLTLYEYSALGAQAAQNTNQFYLGGPATTGLYTNWIADLYNYCANHKLRLDFLSWHRYSHNPSQFSADAMSVYNVLAGRKVPKLVISEWGPTPEKDSAYASGYAAVHSFATVRELIDQIDLATAFEIKDGPGQGNSGWGLLTHDSAGLIPKPRYQAFSWLAAVRGQRLSLSGEGSNLRAWATKEGEGKINVWLINFGQGANPEVVPLEVTGIQNGSWQLRQDLLFGGSNQTDAIVTDNTLRTNFELQPNQVGRMILERR